MPDEGTNQMYQMNQMLDALIGVVGHLLCVCSLRSGALVFTLIVVIHCVQLVPFVIKIRVNHP
jgi:hypothetical protein